MAQETHKITAPIGVEAVEAVESEFDVGKRGLRIVAWAEEAWPDYIAVEDRITGRICAYGLNKDCLGLIGALVEHGVKLRELVRDIWNQARLLDANSHIDGMRLTEQAREEYTQRMEELGVEV